MVINNQPPDNAVTGGVSPVRRAALLLTAPVQRAWIAVRDGAAEHWDVAAQNQMLRQENARLQAQLQADRARIQEAEVLRTENDALREQLSLSRRYTDCTFFSAVVLAAERDPHGSRFLLDCGEENGVAEGQAVVVPDGMIGVVRAVGAGWCECVPVTDAAFQAGAIVTRSGEHGVAQGGGDDLTLRHLPQESESIVGCRVVTSGLGGAYPPNLLLGHIRQLRQAENGLSCEAQLRPAADWESARQVFVITDFDVVE